MASSEPDLAAVPAVLFRPGKKRKVYRQRDAADLEAVPSLSVPPTDHQQQQQQAAAAAASSHDASAEPTAAGRPGEEGAGSGALVLLSDKSGKRGGSIGVEEDDSDDGADSAALSVAEALRLRNARRHRAPRGVEFRAEQRTGAGDEERDDDAASSGGVLAMTTGGGVVGGLSQPQAAGGLARHFAHQTGLASRLVNHHMEQYIESELAKRRAAERPVVAPRRDASHEPNNDDYQDGGADGEAEHDGATEASSSAPGWGKAAAVLPRAGEMHDKTAGLVPALQGKLQEVDLGEVARSRNVAATERARRRLGADDVTTAAQGAGGEAGGVAAVAPGSLAPAADAGRKRVRLGKDGKPWRPKKRRNSEDLERDRLVEEVLRESRPPAEVYDLKGTTTAPGGASIAGGGGHPPGGPSSSSGGAPGGRDEDLGAADDRIAEQFRREFLEAVAQRQRRRTAPINRPLIRKEKNEDILRGPKLGGSRNERAAMRDLLLAKEKEKKGR